MGVYINVANLTNATVVVGNNNCVVRGDAAEARRIRLENMKRVAAIREQAAQQRKKVLLQVGKEAERRTKRAVAEAMKRLRANGLAPKRAKKGGKR